MVGTVTDGRAGGFKGLGCRLTVRQAQTRWDMAIWMNQDV
jgi:hypothetical protein